MRNDIAELKQRNQAKLLDIKNGDGYVMSYGVNNDMIYTTALRWQSGGKRKV